MATYRAIRAHTLNMGEVYPHAPKNKGYHKYVQEGEIITLPDSFEPPHHLEPLDGPPIETDEGTVIPDDIGAMKAKQAYKLIHATEDREIIKRFMLSESEREGGQRDRVMALLQDKLDELDGDAPPEPKKPAKKKPAKKKPKKPAKKEETDPVSFPAEEKA